MDLPPLTDIVPVIADPVKVSVDFDHLIVRDDGEFWGGAEPYLLTVFFTVDGTSARISATVDVAKLATYDPKNDDPADDPLNVTLAPQFNSNRISKVTVRGGHGNIGDVNIGPIELANDGPKRVPIKNNTGRFEATLQPIEVRLTLDAGDIKPSVTVLGVPGFVGVFAMLWEEDFTPEDAVEAANQAVADGIQQLLEDHLSQVNLRHLSLDAGTFNSAQQDIQGQAQAAAISQMNLWELFWGGVVDPDDLLIKNFWYANALQIDPVIPISDRYQGDNGDWILVGEIRREDA